MGKTGFQVLTLVPASSPDEELGEGQVYPHHLRSFREALPLSEQEVEFPPPPVGKLPAA